MKGVFRYRTLTVFVVFIVWSVSVGVGHGKDGSCNNMPSSCGNIANITFPFRLKDHPPPCGYDERGLVELECDSNNRTTLSVRHMKFYVRHINYSYSDNSYYRTDTKLWLVDASVLDSNDSCFIPHLPLYATDYVFGDCRWRDPYTYGYKNFIALVKCSKPIILSPNYTLVDTSPCNHLINTSSPESTRIHYTYALNTSLTFDIPYLLDEYSCVVLATIPVPSYGDVFPIEIPTLAYNSQVSLTDVHRWLSYGFQASLEIYYDDSCFGETFKDRWNYFWKDADLLYGLKNTSYIAFNIIKQWYWTYDGTGIYYVGRIVGDTISGWLLLRTLIGISCLIGIVIYKWRRRHSSAHDEIEEFLCSQNNLMPIKYSYYEIKKITQGFKNKLGQGGFGSVYKGKLRSGDYVAVKVLLSKSKADGQDFISEVATIGRIHHVNVVRLVGFCVEGSKQALVYDFMPNGSLDKLLSSKQDGSACPVTWLKMHEIALGVARGIEYLHRGCEMQILHFDIKPHNILLDENFMAKVSDFGLAKLYPVDDSIVSLTAVRGTLGFMAPELFYKNIGGVSYKADVYSFGMLLMEMVGKRKRLIAFEEHVSQIYFPTWIYDHFDQHEELMELEDASEDEKKMVKKMILVAFWCVQMNPTSRPSMNKVLEMLEGEIEHFEMPPKPSMHPGDMPLVNADTNDTDVEIPTSSCNGIDTITIQFEGR